MRTQLKLAMAVVMVGLGMCQLASRTTHGVDIYVTSNDGSFIYGAPVNFGKIDTTTGAYSNIATLSGNIFNLTWNPVAGNFFVTDTNPSGGTGGSAATYLKTLTTTGTLSAQIGSAMDGKTIHGLAYRNAGSPLYAAEYQSDDTGTISPTLGGFTLQANSPVSMSTPLGGRYSIMNDTLYFATGNSTNRFGTVNFSTGAYTNINTANAALKNVVLANDGTTMYGLFGDGTAGNQALYSIDVATGNTSFVTSISGTGLGTYFHGAAIIVNPVPEPSTYALATIAAGVMGYVARRRKARRG